MTRPTSKTDQLRQVAQSKRRQLAIQKGFRSGLEEAIADDLRSRSVHYLFEEHKLKYTVPETEHTYTPDFIIAKDRGNVAPLGANWYLDEEWAKAHIIVESKGQFTLEDRKKHLLIKAQYPHLDIRFVFTRSTGKIRKGSKTTYADWCEKHGFIYADKVIPDEWFS